ncbi:MAG: hypothetical protein C4321_03455 [Chloroflexota bacterium]
MRAMRGRRGTEGDRRGGAEKDGPLTASASVSTISERERSREGSKKAMSGEESRRKRGEIWGGGPRAALSLFTLT